MTEAQKQPILLLEHINKRFGAVRALSDMTFEAYLGEVVALVGDNGAGKSTLIKIISGAYRPDSGRYVFDGREVTVTSPKDATDLGIQTVYQDLALCDNLDVVANMYLGREESGGGVLDEVDMERNALRYVRDLHVRIPSVRTRIAALSGGQRQSVAVARAVMWNSKVVLLDEPTAALGVEQTQQVKDLIRRLRENGLAVVVISHNLADVFDVADRIIVMRLGTRVATYQATTTNQNEVVASITGAVFGKPKTENGAESMSADAAEAQ